MPHRLIAAPLGSLMYTVTANALSHSNAQNAPPAVKAPLVRFGVVADIQYANLADGQNYAKTQTRRYRGALEMVDKAVAYWAAQKVGFVAQLGDVIDGQCATKTHTSATDLASVLAKLSRLPVDYLNLIGNHELYNFDRPTLARELNTRRGGGHPAGVEREFYHTRPCKGWRVLVLDAYQDAVIPNTGAESQSRGQTILEAHNPNMTPEAKANGAKWFDGLEGKNCRFVPYNGGYGKEQLAWLKSQIAEAIADNERIVVLSHVVIHPESCEGTTMAWDYDKALELIENSCGTVALVLAGHDHEGGFAQSAISSTNHGSSAAQKSVADKDGPKGGTEVGTYYVTLQSPLNRGRDGECFGAVELYDDQILIKGPKLDHLLHASLLEQYPSTTSVMSGADVSSGEIKEDVLSLPLAPCRTGILPKGRRIES